MKTRMIVHDVVINGKMTECLYKIICGNDAKVEKNALAEAIAETGDKTMRIITDEVAF